MQLASSRLVATAILVGVVIWFALAQDFTSLEPRADLTDFGSLLAALFFAALVLERALDVLLSLAFGESADQLDADVRVAQAQVDTVKAATPAAAARISAAESELERVRTQRMGHRAKTMKLALPAATLIGALISAFGLRTLHSLVTPESVEALSPSQRNCLVGLDILLTGFVLGGGSDPIHRLMTVFRNWTESQRTKVT